MKKGSVLSKKKRKKGRKKTEIGRAGIFHHEEGKKDLYEFKKGMMDRVCDVLTSPSSEAFAKVNTYSMQFTPP